MRAPLLVLAGWSAVAFSATNASAQNSASLAQAAGAQLPAGLFYCFAAN